MDFEEITELTKLLKGRKVKAGVSLWLFAAKSIWNSAERSGLTRALKDAGAVLISGTCSVSTMLNEIIISRGFTSAATNSAKVAHYLPSSWGLKIHYGSTADSIEAAVTGRWNV